MYCSIGCELYTVYRHNIQEILYGTNPKWNNDFTFTFSFFSHVAQIEIRKYEGSFLSQFLLEESQQELGVEHFPFVRHLLSTTLQTLLCTLTTNTPLFFTTFQAQEPKERRDCKVKCDTGGYSRSVLRNAWRLLY